MTAKRDLTEYMSFPFAEMPPVRDLDEPVAVEPPRSGEHGGDCKLCAGEIDILWSDEDWLLTLYEPSPFRGVVLLGPKLHVESIAGLPARLAAGLGPMLARVQRAIESLGGIGRVHVNVWGDGGAHLHIWFYPRPHGVLQLRGTFLALWGLVLPDLPDDEVRAAGNHIAAAMDASAP